MLCFKSPRMRKREKRLIRRCANQSFLFERALFLDKPFSNCPARAAAACSRRSVRYCVSLVALETPHSGCPKAPPARREGGSVRFAMLCFKSLRMRKREKRTLFLDKPLSDCPARAAAACSRRSVRYCVSLMALETTLSECPQQNNKDNTPLYDMNSNTPQC